METCVICGQAVYIPLCHIEGNAICCEECLQEWESIPFDEKQRILGDIAFINGEVFG